MVLSLDTYLVDIHDIMDLVGLGKNWLEGNTHIYGTGMTGIGSQFGRCHDHGFGWTGMIKLCVCNTNVFSMTGYWYKLYNYA